MELYFRTWCGNSGLHTADVYLHLSEIPDAFILLHCAMLKLLCYTADDEESSFHIEGLDIPQKRIEKYERCKAIPYLKLGTGRSKGNNDEIAKTMSSREKYGSASLWFTRDGKQFLEDSTIIPVLVGSILSGLVILLGATGKVKLCENLKNMLSIIILRCYCCEDLLQEKGRAN